MIFNDLVNLSWWFCAKIVTDRYLLKIFKSAFRSHLAYYNNNKNCLKGNNYTTVFNKLVVYKTVMYQIK